MSVSALKRKFYKVYNKNYNFIERLVDNKSGGLTLLYCSHILLDYYFNNYEDYDAYPEEDEAVYFFSNEENLSKSIDFFIDRINILVELDNIFSENDFEEIVPLMFTKLKFQELFERYKYELEENNLVERIEKTINELNNHIENGIFMSDERYDEIEFEFESYMEYVDIDDVLSSDLYTLYEVMLYDEEIENFDEEDLEEDYYNEDNKVTLGFLKTQYSILMKQSNEEYGGELLSLKRDSLYYKMIIKYKKIIDKILFLCEFYEEGLDSLSEKLGFDFLMISMFCTSLYLESLRLIDTEHKYLRVESLDIDKFIEYKKYLILIVLISIILSVDDSLSPEQFAEFKQEILQNIYENETASPEFFDLYKHYETDFLNDLGFECETMDELIDEVYEKISHVCNEYY